MTTDVNQHDHDEIMSLLPWFVNQTLDEGQANMVSDHLKNCDECQREVQLLATMKETVLGNAKAGHQGDSQIETHLEAVMARIDVNEPMASSSAKKHTFLQQSFVKLTGFFSASPLGMQGAVAMCGVLLAVVVFQFYNEQPSEDYSVLSSPETQAASVRLSVETMPSTDRDEVKLVMQTLFDKYGQAMGIEEGMDGAYVIVVNDPMGVDALNDFVLDLNNQPTVKQVEVLP